MAAKKNITLRAFKVINNSTNIGKDPIGVLNLLSERLKDSLVSDRKMQLNQDDLSMESDIMTNHNVGNTHVFGVMFRVVKSDEVNIFPDNLLQKETISMDDIYGMDKGSNVIKNQYYFLIDNNYLITNMYYNGGTYPFETYLNWLLNDIRTNIISIIPHVVPPPEVKLSDIKEVTISDSFISHAIKEKGSNVNKTENIKISTTVAKQLLSDTKSLSDIDLDQIIVAELKVKFKRPSGMTTEQFQAKYGALLKPISDLECVKFKTKKGTSLSGKDIVKTKKVDIVLTGTNKLSEPFLSQEMEKFLIEIYE